MRYKVLFFSNIDTEFKFLNSISVAINSSQIETFHIYFNLERDFFSTCSLAKFLIKIFKISNYSFIIRVITIIDIYLIKLLKNYGLSLFSNKYSKHILKKHSPDCLILGSDNSYMSLFMVSAAHRLCIPVFCFPFSLSNYEEFVFTLNHNKYSFRQNLNYLLLLPFYLLGVKVISKFFLEVNHKLLLVVTKTPILIQLILRIDPINPWVICGGNSDRVFVPSLFEKKYYLNSNIKGNKISLYSIINENAGMNYSLKEELQNYLNHCDIIWSPPPDFYPNKFFNSYADLISYFINEFKIRNLRVVISVHPRISKLFLEDFINIENIRIIDLPIENLLRFGKAFVSTQSATIRFALKNKLHIINFDIFEFSYSEYNNLPMVKTVKTPIEFSETLNQLDNDISLSNYFYNSIDSEFFEAKNPILKDTLINFIHSCRR